MAGTTLMYLPTLLILLHVLYCTRLCIDIAERDLPDVLSDFLLNWFYTWRRGEAPIWEKFPNYSLFFACAALFVQDRNCVELHRSKDLQQCHGRSQAIHMTDIPLGTTRQFVSNATSANRLNTHTYCTKSHVRDSTSLGMTHYFFSPSDKI